MLDPPFKFAMSTYAAAAAVNGADSIDPPACCDAAESVTVPQSGRRRLAQLDSHLYCSVLGTCLSTAELRKLMARFIDVRDASDLEVHHEAVRLAGLGAAAAKALHKALDQRHDAVIRRFARARDGGALVLLWEDALRQGEIPGAYWALLTHRDAPPELRQKVFGDVHMLSHLVGAANRADIRRLVALEQESADLRERLERQQLRSQEQIDERDRTIARLRQDLADAEKDRARSHVPSVADVSSQLRVEEVASAAALVAQQTERREHAERAALFAADEANRLRGELEHLGRHAQALGRELAAAEGQLQERVDGQGAPDRPREPHLRDRRILYVGGRPSSMPAIRDLVLRHGGEFQRHDGGVEDRKGLLAAGVAWAELVVFPVDCIDHDSAGNLKRLCLRQGVTFVPLRSAGIASFVAGVAAASIGTDADAERSRPPICRKHG